MGSTVRYHCTACGFTTSELRVGWGRAGRAAFWGAVGICPTCKDLTTIDLSARAPERGARSSDRRCAACEGVVTVAEGLAATIRCPHCGAPLAHTALGQWS